jgi:hypothetical protein
MAMRDYVETALTGNRKGTLNDILPDEEEDEND